jgi:hypothetical protein
MHSQLLKVWLRIDSKRSGRYFAVLRFGRQMDTLGTVRELFRNFFAAKASHLCL